MSGTPIGLPGPPHLPLGGPAGLQKHVMRNHTPVRIPGPTKKMKISVRQSPGYSYPKPANRIRVVESTTADRGHFRRPADQRVETISDSASQTRP